MRPVLAVVAVLLLSALAPAAVAGGSQHSSDAPAAFDASAHSPAVPATTGSVEAVESVNQTVTGTVTYANGSVAGDATVLVGSRTQLENSSPAELRELAAADPQDVAVTRTDAAGNYSLTPGEGVPTDAVVAVSDDGVSQVQPFGTGAVNLTLRPDRTLAVETPAVRAEPGSRTTVSFQLVNNGDEPVEGLQVTLGRLPDGWNVVDTAPGSATYSQANTTFTWERIEPGERVTAEMRVFVAINAEKRTYDLPVFADSESHVVRAGTLSVAVAYPTDEPSGTAADGEGTGLSAPGFGPVVAVAALLGVALAAIARRN